MSKTTRKRVKKARTKDRKFEIFREWIDSWESDQADIVARLCAAARNDDHEQIVICSGQLRGMTENRFTALRGIVGVIDEGLSENKEDM